MEQQGPGAAQPAELSREDRPSRYVLRIGGQVAAQAQYTREGERVAFTHTEVEPEHEGQGLASRLAAYALDDVRAQGLKAVPRCSFIARYVARHEQEYGDLVAP